jgi:hypothetical protein
MAWRAITALDDARDATESLLWPPDRGTWIRLAIIAFFVGGVGFPSFSGNTGNVSVPTDGPPGGTPSLPVDAELLVAVALVVVAVAVVIGLLLGVIGAVMEFVLVEGLRSRDVHIRAPFSEYLRSGLRLFGFRFAFTLLWLLVVGVPVALIVLGWAGIPVGPEIFLLAIPLVFLLVVLGFVTSIVLGLTTDFVVPAMLVEDLGVLAGWRRVLPVLRREWKEILLYMLVRFGLSILVGIAVAIVVGLLALIAAIPFVVVGGVLAFGVFSVGSGPIGTAAIAVLAVLALLFGLVLLAIGLAVQVPVVTFFRYYALSLLGYLDPSLDLVGVSEPADADAGSTP